MSRPVIGITGYHDHVRWDMWDCAATVIQDSYVGGVTDHGARAVVLPPDTVDTDVLRRLDGLLLTSGPDIAPGRYGRAPHDRTESPSALRDEAELLLLRAALAMDLPVLGICRGMQLLAVATGGTLHQHLPDEPASGSHWPVGDQELGQHGVRFAPDSLAAAVFGRYALVNSHHHQGVDDPGTLLVTGRADDGLAEAIEHRDRRFVVGVQWHPEIAGGAALFGAFVAACAAETGTAAAPARDGARR